MSFYCVELETEFTASRLISVIIDVESYPEFVPYCSSVHLREKPDEPSGAGPLKMVADMKVGFGLIKVMYTSDISYSVEQGFVCVNARPNDNLLYLKNEWRLSPFGNSGNTKVSFYVEFKLRNPILGLAAEAALPRVAQETVHAFLRQAGKSAAP